MGPHKGQKGVKLGKYLKFLSYRTRYRINLIFGVWSHWAKVFKFANKKMVCRKTGPYKGVLKIGKKSALPKFNQIWQETLLNKFVLYVKKFNLGPRFTR